MLPEGVNPPLTCFFGLSPKPEAVSISKHNVDSAKAVIQQAATLYLLGDFHIENISLYFKPNVYF